MLSELPLHSFFVIVYVLPVFFLAGFTTDVKVFFQVFAIVYLLVYCSRTLAMFSSVLMPTFTLSCFLAQTFFSMYIMSAGFFINLDNIFSGKTHFVFNLALVREHPFNWKGGGAMVYWGKTFSANLILKNILSLKWAETNILLARCSLIIIVFVEKTCQEKNSAAL